jgi:hypothetical protein
VTARVALALCVGVAVATASCGGGGVAKRAKPASEATTPRAIPEPWNAPPEVVRARIETLDREIAARAGTLDVDGEAPGTDVEPPTHVPMPTPTTAPGAEACVRSTRPVCRDVCSLADSICNAADEICELAAALPGDVWAAGRCAAGRSSCARARERCCGC